MSRTAADWSVEVFENQNRRTEIIRKGFAEGLSAEDVNKLLTADYCEALYARNIYEAALIYAFDHRKSYEEWQAMIGQCRKLYDPGRQASGTVMPLADVRKYVEEGSRNEDSGTNTAYITKEMQEQLSQTTDEDSFISFLLNNIERFSSVREKARYYFLKYILYYIDEKTDAYLKACGQVDRIRLQKGEILTEEEKNIEKTAVEELSFLKPLKPLQRSADTAKMTSKNYMPLEEKKKWLAGTSLTPGGIYEAMNYYYFGYISMEWLDLCVEMYPYFEDWPMAARKKIAEGLGLITRKTSPEEEAAVLDGLGERIEQIELRKEEELNKIYAKDGSTQERDELYAESRKAANAFRDFILGKTDVNRRTLIMFLLFINANTRLEKDRSITIPRLNDILINCGFSQLRPDREFDKFVIAFMRAEDPMGVFEDMMEERIKKTEESVLYNIYESAYNHQKELIRDLLKNR